MDIKLHSCKGGEFRTYGLQVATIMEQDPEDRADPMARIFPRVTKCSFNKYGPTGSLQRVDAMCVLPINIINEVFLLIEYIFIIRYNCRRFMFFSGSGSSS